MKPTRQATGVLFICLGLIVAAAASARAQDRVERFLRESTGAIGGAGVRIDLQADQRAFRDVVDEIRRKSGANIVLLPGIDEKVSLDLRGVHWAQVLQEAADQARCLVEDKGDYLRISQPATVTMEWRDTDIRVVLEYMALQSGANIVVSDKVDAKVSLNFHDVHWHQALKTVVETAGPYAVVQGEGNILLVVPRAELQSQRETRVFPLRYIRPRSTYTAVVEDSSSRGKFFIGEPTKAQGDLLKDFTLYKALKSIIEGSASATGAAGATASATGETIEYNIETNSFIITATKPKLDEVAEIIRRLDHAPNQVHVEVKFIRTSLDDLFERGLKLQNPTNTRLDGIDARLNLNSTLFPSLAGPEGQNVKLTQGTGAPKGGQYPFFFGRGDSLFQSNFQVPAVLDFTQMSAIIRYTKSDANSRVIQRPVLTTQDHQEATIFVGESVPFAEQEAKTDQNNNVTVTIKESGKSPAEVGFRLFITPHVIPGSDDIAMTIITRATTLTGTTAQGSGGPAGFERFTFTDPKSGFQSFIDLPRVQNQTLVTKLTLESGYTAVLGGLLAETRTSSVSRIPLLSSLPLLGNLFTFKSDRAITENLVVFITPKVIRSSGDYQKILEIQNSRARDADYYQRHDDGSDKPPKPGAQGVDKP